MSKPLGPTLGLKAGLRAFVKGPPPGYNESLGPRAKDVRFLPRLAPGLDFVHFFTKEKAELERSLPNLKRSIAPTGVIWVSWPKEGSGLTSDLSEESVRKIAVTLGLSDAGSKVVAIDASWLGLKLVAAKRGPV